jgi:hypothetical protein
MILTTKFTYNEYIGPYFLSHVVLRFSPSDLPEPSEGQVVGTRNPILHLMGPQS